MARSYRTIGFSVPPAIADRIEEIARRENLTKSELFREMFRCWEQVRHARRLAPPDEGWVHELVRETRKEEQSQPMGEKALQDEFEALTEYGVQQAERLGIREEDVVELVKQVRKKRKRALKGRS